MSTADLRQEAKAIIDALTGPQLRAASEFLAFIKARRPNAATRELLGIPDFAESFARGLKDVEQGRVKPWRQVKRV